METLNIKPKDIIQFIIYLVMFIGFLVRMDNKQESMLETMNEWKTEKKEFTSEQRQDFQLIQTKLEALGVTAELNKQNIGINKIDIALLNAKVDKLLDKD